MTLSCTRPWSTNGYGPGIYISEATVVNVEDISGEQLPFLDQPVDIGLKLHLDIGRDFQPEFIIAGNFKRDPATGEVTGWGGAFVVQDALARLGYAGNLTDENTIPVDVPPALIGKKLYRLSYVAGRRDNGKLRYSGWNQIGTLDEGPEALAKRFKRSLTKGCPKNYQPDVLGEPVPATVAQTEPVAEADPF